MDFSAATFQFAGSLIAILALAGLAYWLKLGPPPQLADEEDARTAADEAVSGFNDRLNAATWFGTGQAWIYSPYSAIPPLGWRCSR